MLGFEDPLGKKLTLAGREGRIIGLAAAAVTFAVAVATVSFQVLKTARINPVECLRYE